MTEPASSSAAAAAGGVAAWKAIGGAAGASAAGAGLASIVVMCMTHPRTPREWAVGVISTAVCSIAGGAWVMHYLGLQELATQGPLGLMELLGACFACGLPGWAAVRGVFRWLEKHEGQDIAELAGSVKDDAKKVMS